MSYQVLLDADAELVSGQDRYGKAPLHCAVDAGSEELVRLLLQYGADINIRCHDGMTPLMMCCTSDRDGKKAEVMEALLEAGAMIDLKDFRGKRTALHVSSERFYFFYLIISVLFRLLYMFCLSVPRTHHESQS